MNITTPPVAAITHEDAVALQELLMRASDRTGDWVQALAAAEEFALTLTAIPAEDAFDNTRINGRPVIHADGTTIHSRAIHAHMGYNGGGHPAPAKYWMLEPSTAPGGWWIAVAEGDADLNAWFDGTGITPEPWMRRPIGLTPPLGTLRFSTLHPLTGQVVDREQAATATPSAPRDTETGTGGDTLTLKAYAWYGKSVTLQHQRLVIAATSVDEACAAAGIKPADWRGIETGDEDEAAVALASPGILFWRWLNSGTFNSWSMPAQPLGG